MQKNTLAATIFVFAVIFILSFVFKAGLMIGERKANFSCAWGENYHRNFGGPKQGFFPSPVGRNFDRGGMPSPDGVFGKIIQINIATGSDRTAAIIIKDSHNIEKSVLLNNETIIKRFQETIKPADLRVDEFVVIIGEPNNQGQIEAKLLRIMPSPIGFDKRYDIEKNF